jgi:hypothetical protein
MRMRGWWRHSEVVQFSASGETPTGLSTFDLQTPEPDPVSYGPYPVNRAVQGLRGNGARFVCAAHANLA